MGKLSADDQMWVKKVSELSNRISQKLLALSVLTPESCGNIAHHLAEVCISSRTIESEIVPRLLVAAVSDGESLAELSHDFLTELEEIRDSIEAMNPDVTALMNALNK